MRNQLCFVLLTAMLVAGCQSGPSGHRPAMTTSEPISSPGQYEAIKAATQANGLPAGLFPAEPGRIACVIQGGGPPPGIEVPGICETSAAKDRRGTWTVTFTEYWDGLVFHSAGEAASGQLRHSWSYTVDATQQVAFENEDGNLPPQSVL